MKENHARRPPADIERRVLLEAGHRCAIPACRHPEVEIHHIVPWSKCHKHEYENMIALCPNCHKRANAGKIDRKSLRGYKAALRLAHDRFSNFEVDLLFALGKEDSNGWFEIPYYLFLLVNRIADAGYVTAALLQPCGMQVKEGYQPVTAFLDVYQIRLTNKGREYVRSLGLEIV